MGGISVYCAGRHGFIMIYNSLLGYQQSYLDVFSLRTEINEIDIDIAIHSFVTFIIITAIITPLPHYATKRPGSRRIVARSPNAQSVSGGPSAQTGRH